MEKEINKPTEVEQKVIDFAKTVDWSPERIAPFIRGEGGGLNLLEFHLLPGVLVLGKIEKFLEKFKHLHSPIAKVGDVLVLQEYGLNFVVKVTELTGEKDYPIKGDYIGPQTGEYFSEGKFRGVIAREATQADRDLFKPKELTPDDYKTGVWYRSEKGSLLFLVSKEGVNGFGINSRGVYVQNTEWFTNFKENGFHTPGAWVEAGESVWKRALKAEAEKRGYLKDGAKFEAVFNQKNSQPVRTFCSIGTTSVAKIHGVDVCVKVGTPREEWAQSCSNPLIFKNGEWAPIIENGELLQEGDWIEFRNKTKSIYKTKQVTKDRIGYCLNSIRNTPWKKVTDEAVLKYLNNG